MNPTISLQYRGQLHVDATHLASNTTLNTDAPTDNGGKGESFSPTDLLATALASCAITIMAKKAESMNLALGEVRAEVQKIMAESPRRVASVVIDFYFPGDYDAKTRQILEKTAHACPVAQSVSTELKQDFRFHFATL